LTCCGAKNPAKGASHLETFSSQPHTGLPGKVAIAAIKGDLTIPELAKRFDVHPNSIVQWKSQLLERATEAFDGESAKQSGPDIKELHAKIGQLALENGFFRTRALACRRVERKAMIDRNHPLPISDQAELLDLSRSGLYYTPVPISESDLELVREIDRLHTDHPFAGARMLRDMFRLRGYRVGRRPARGRLRANTTILASTRLRRFHESAFFYRSRVRAAKD
jgi:transposase-like protein